jgi:oligosaccharyltransferase complex subunit alpha (ribophorin I)
MWLWTQVVLPEGSTDLKAELPFAAQLSMKQKLSYLDTIGRPVLVLNKRDVVPEHNVPLDVTYRFSSLAMLQEPMLLVVAFFAFFCLLIIYSRCEFSLSPVKQA